MSGRGRLPLTSNSTFEGRGLSAAVLTWRCYGQNQNGPTTMQPRVRQ